MNFAAGDLRQVPVFQSLTDADLDLLVQNSLTRSVEEDGFFFFEGDAAEYLYVLIHGRVKLVQSHADGHTVNLRTVQPWQLFGALGAVRDGATYPATAQAMENSTALAIRGTFLRGMMETRPSLALGLMALMTNYIQEMQTRYRELATERVEQRIARSLLRLTAQAGRKVQGGIELSYSRQDVAEMSGATLYTVSRVLAEWERRQLLRAGRGRVTIIDPHGLVRVAEDLEK